MNECKPLRHGSKKAIQKSDYDELLIRYNEDDIYGDGNNFAIACKQEVADGWLREGEEKKAAEEAGHIPVWSGYRIQHICVWSGDHVDHISVCGQVTAPRRWAVTRNSTVIPLLGRKCRLCWVQ